MSTDPDVIPYLGRPLTKLETKLLLDCANGHDIRSSYRDEDRAKQALRRMGLLAYEGKPKRWTTTHQGENLAIAIGDAA